MLAHRLLDSRPGHNQQLLRKPLFTPFCSVAGLDHSLDRVSAVSFSLGLTLGPFFLFCFYALILSFWPSKVLIHT